MGKVGSVVLLFWSRLRKSLVLFIQRRGLMFSYGSILSLSFSLCFSLQLYAPTSALSVLPPAAHHHLPCYKWSLIPQVRWCHFCRAPPFPCKDAASDTLALVTSVLLRQSARERERASSLVSFSFTLYGARWTLRNINNINPVTCPNERPWWLLFGKVASASEHDSKMWHIG